MERSRGNNYQWFQTLHIISRWWYNSYNSFRLPYSYCRFGTYTLWMELKKGWKVTSTNGAIFLQRVSNNRFLSRFSQYISISRVSSMLDGWPTILQRGLFPSISLFLFLPFSLFHFSPSLSLFVFFYAYSFFFTELPSF